MSTTTDPSTAYIDSHQVTQVLHRMAWCQDRRHWPELETLLAEQVAIAYGDPDTELATLTRADLLENWRRGLDHTSSQHVLTGIVVTIDGDTAHATLNETAWMQADQPMGSPLYQFGTAMETTLKRSPEGWRITHLRVVPIWSTGNAAVLGSWSQPTT